MNDMNKDFYDCKDIAKILNVSERYARIIMVQHEFPSYKLGCKVRVRVKDFNDWFENIKGKDIPIDDSVNKFQS